MEILDVDPGILQDEEWDCGAGISCAVYNFLTGDSKTVAEFRKLLGTTEESGTSPEAIIKGLNSLGLNTHAHGDWDIQELIETIKDGQPIICPIQMYEDEEPQIAEEQAGHYIVVIGASDEEIVIHDPYQGRRKLGTFEFLGRWEDQNEEGEFIHYGIAVGRNRMKKKMLLGDTISGGIEVEPITGPEDDDEKSFSLRNKKAGPHKYGCVMVNLEGKAAEAVLALGRQVQQSHLGEEGLEDEIHATALYGLHGNDPDEVQERLKGFGPIKMTLGGVSIFETKDADVLKVDVDSDDLERLHEKLKELPHTLTHPVFKGHVTIGYLQPGFGNKYANRMKRLDMDVVSDKVVFSPANGKKKEISMKSCDEQATKLLGRLLMGDKISKEAATMLKEALAKSKTAEVGDVILVGGVKKRIARIEQKESSMILTFSDGVKRTVPCGK